MKTKKFHDVAVARWMVVDDNADILFLTGAILERVAGATVECFHSPLKALAAFAAAPENFGLVVTDFEMPGMDGVEFCRRLRELAPSLKVLLATGSGIISPDAAAALGFCGLLHKPFPVAELKRALVRAGVMEKEADGEVLKNYLPGCAGLMSA